MRVRSHETWPQIIIITIGNGIKEEPKEKKLEALKTEGKKLSNEKKTIILYTDSASCLILSVLLSYVTPLFSVL